MSFSFELSPRGRRTILMVEDDDDVAELVAEMLENLGYRAVRAATAARALDTLEESRQVDLVFSDVMMPGGMNGVELAREIRRRQPELPVVLTSGYAEAFRHEAAAEGLLMLPKPYDMDDLAQAMAQALARTLQ